MANFGVRSDLPAFRILVNGTALTDEARADVLSIEVHQDIDNLSMFALQLNSWDENRVKWVDGPLFSEGASVEIRMGFEGATLHLVFAGEITGLEPSFTADAFTLTVRGYDRRHRLLRGQKTRSFVQMTDSDIAAAVAAGAGLISQTTSTGAALEYVLQHNQTDLEFLRERARRIGFEVTVEDRTLHFRPPAFESRPVATLSLGEDLAEFSARLSTMTQVGQVEVRAWDRKDRQVIVSQAGSTPAMGGTITGPAASDRAAGKARSVSVQQPVLTYAEAEGMAKSRFTEMALSFIQAEGVCVGGRSELRAGTVITIDGVGRRFSGPYYVTGVTHTLTPERYATAFTAKRNAT